MYNNQKLSNNAEVMLAYVKKFIKLRGYSPSHKEIADNTYNSKYMVYKALIEFEQKEYIRRQKKKPRTIVVRGMRMVED